jgi:hypothetical protein
MGLLKTADNTPSAHADFLRVERIFADTWSVVRSHASIYLILTLVFGVAPGLLITSLFGVPPGDLGQAPMGARILSMVLFVLGDAVLIGALAVVVFGHIAGRSVSLGQALAALRGRYWALLLAAAAIDVPMLVLNLSSSLMAASPATSLALYGVRFAVGITLGAVFAGAGAAILAEGLTARQGLIRAAALTRGQRPRTALFFAAFFLLKVLGPYLLIDFGLRSLAGLLFDGPAAETALALAGLVVWNLLACALGISMALIYAALREQRSGNGADLDPGNPPKALGLG